MRFVCLFDIDARLSWLYKTLTELKTPLVENGINLYPLKKIDDKQQGLFYLYGASAVKKYDETRNKSLTAMTITAFGSAWGLTINTNITASNTFVWNVSRQAEIRSSAFFTILTETGIWLVSPARLTTSKEITGFNILNRSEDMNNLYAFEGETAADYFIDWDNDTVIPSLIDSTMKTLIINKHRALFDIIQFTSGVDSNPLDYINYLGIIYVVISRKDNKEGDYTYTAVKEMTASYTIAGSDITPVTGLSVSDPIPIFYNRLESKIFAEQSIIGPNCVSVGTPTYGPGYFGNAFYNTNNAGYSSNFLYIINPFYGLTKGTFEFWFRFSATPQSNYDAFFDFYSGTRLALYRDQNANTSYFLFFGVGGVAMNFPADTNWHHFALLWDEAKSIDGSKSGKILIDGVSAWTTTATITNNTGATNKFLLSGLQVSGDLTRVQHPLDGYLDEMKIYNILKTDFSKRFKEGF